MKEGYKKCPYCDNEIKEGAIKCQYCKEMLSEGKNLNKGIEEESGKERKYDLCRYCQQNKPNPELSKKTTLSRIATEIPLIVAKYVRTESNQIIIPRCSECYERQQKKIKKCAIKCFLIASLVGLPYGIFYFSEEHDLVFALFIVVLFGVIFGSMAFGMAYPKVSESLKLSNEPEWKKMREEGWQMK